MKNLIQDGVILDYLNGGSAITSGSPVVMGNRIGVAVEDIASGDTGEVLMEGVCSLDKATGQAWSIGDEIFWDVGASKTTNVGTGNVHAGFAVEAALTGDTSGKICLEESAKQVALQADTVAADLTAMKADFNALLAKMKAAGIMANS